jgi:hypothetical protein
MLGFESRPTRASIELGNEFGGGGRGGRTWKFLLPPTKSARLELYRRVMMTMINVVTRD